MVDDDEAARIDALRRRLYARGATAEDRAAYEARRGAVAPPEAPVAAAPRSRGRVLPLVAAALAVVALALAIPHPQPRPAVPAEQAEQAAIPLPTPVEVSVQGVATTGQRFRGVGPMTVQLVTGSAPPFGGRLVVTLTDEDGVALGWRATRPAVRTDHARYEQVLAQSAVTRRSALGHPEASSWHGDPPAAIAVRAPAGTRWTLTVLLLAPA